MHFDCKHTNTIARPTQSSPYPVIHSQSDTPDMKTSRDTQVVFLNIFNRPLARLSKTGNGPNGCARCAAAS